MKKQIIRLDGYAQLAANIKKELTTLEVLIRGRMVQGYRKIGGYICKNILENKDRADYGEYLIKRLSKDIGIGQRTLERTVQFYKAYPQIASQVTQLSWTHFLHLLSVRGEAKRRQLQEQAVSQGWNALELKRRIKALKEKERKREAEIVPQLSFTRGQLHAYKLIKSSSKVSIDLGFQMRRDFDEERGHIGDYIEAVKENGDYSINRISVPEESLFSYLAKVEEIIDGDTIKAIIDCDFKMSIRQKLRLRGIDCPEIDTAEGQRAKRFVESRLKSLEFIIIKTYKDQSDKYDRYLADIFYLQGEADPQKVADTGNFLNQELLNNGLAKKM